MSLQTADLAMAGLGIVGDEPPTPLAPPLKDGIHLRWAFQYQRGFPWHGYYLFRRMHQRGKSDCLSERDFRDATSHPAKTAMTRLGVLHSDAELRLESESGHLGVDLSAGTFVRLRLNPAAQAHSVEVSVAFREAAKLRCRALADGVVVAEDVLVGSKSETLTLELAADRISVIEIEAGPAVMFLLCVYPLATAVQGGWTEVPTFPYPLCLPVAHADYPCPSKPADAAAAQTLALGRVSYGDPSIWSSEFAGIHRTLEALVEDGPPPVGEAMHLRSQQVPIATPAEGAPDRQVQHPLAMALLPTVHPAFAQMLGLYFLDTTTEEGRALDYLILADHTGVLGGSAHEALAWLDGEPVFTAVDAWVCFDLIQQRADPLAPPTDVRAYSLPGVSSANDGAEPGSRAHAGLTWDLGRAASGTLMANSPVLYHVWRVDFGPDEPSQAAAESEYSLLTEQAPVLVAMPGGPPGAEPERPSPWPPFRMHKVDRQLAEGWHNHRVSGIDLFGRHSILSAPARWFQWEPQPEPAPWYYQQPPGTRAIHDFAIRTLDKTPPPPPPGVEASSLDPLDPLIVRDDLYDEWQADLSDAERATLVGIRVRWRWPRTHQAQAPRAREFRIYLQLGSDLPAEHASAHAWQMRRYVVGLDDHVLESEQGRDYELIIPQATDPQRTGFEAVPSLAEPVRYGHLAVTVADDRQHSLDHPKWTGTPFGERHGNESVVGAPAKLFRVLRVPPPPPRPVPAPAPRVFASRADYHGVSYFTYRFRPAPNLTEHVYRAVADSVFKADWSRRPRPPLATDDPQLFPSEAEDPRWGQPLRESVAQELDQLNHVAPGLAGRTEAMQAYNNLSDDALRVLAGLQGNHTAFTQRTLEPLDPDEPDPEDPALLRHRDRRGPDTPDDYVPRADRRAFVDALDGVSTSRYLYRSAAVDGAHNRSALGIASPPVYLPDVVPPRPPRGLMVRGEDRAITLRWRSNLEADLAAYRVYRTESAGDATDPGKMQLVKTLSETRPPTARPGHVSWTDDGVDPLKTLHYQVLAVDTTGNLSSKARPVAARAFDDTRPEPPVWNPAAIDPGTNTATLTWTSPDPDLRCLVQRFTEGIGWEAVSPWLARGLFVFDDDQRQPDLAYRYRLRVMDRGGRMNRSHNELLA